MDYDTWKLDNGEPIEQPEEDTEDGPGIYLDMDFDDYLAIDAVSNTAMGAAAKSARHFKFALPLEKQKHLVLGNMVHTFRLEPKHFKQRYSVCPDYRNDSSNVTKNGTRSRASTTSYVTDKTAEFVAAEEAKGREVVPYDWYREMLTIVEALHGDGQANALFNTRGPFEVTLVWDDPETGIRCKGRMDKLCEHQGKFCDLKTCQDLLKAHRSFTDWNYARQMAHYRAGYAVLTGELLTPWVCAVEKQSPYCVHTAPVDDESIEWGESEQQRLLQLIADCRERDEWPGPELPDKWRVAEWKLNADPIELVVGGQKVSI